MPVKYKRKQMPKKKTKRGRFRFTRPIRYRDNVVAGRGFPKKMTMTHKFIYNGTLTNSTGAPSTIATEQFYVNGMFQPVASGATHQPMYYDQMTPIYVYYTVIGAKCKVKFINNGAANNGAYVAMFYNDDQATITPTLITSMIEQTGGKYAIMLSSNPNGSGSGSSSERNLSMTWSAKKNYVGSKDIIGNSELKGTITSNPTRTPAWVIAMQDLAATTTESIDYVVEIEYIAVWNVVRDRSGS